MLELAAGLPVAGRRVAKQVEHALSSELIVAKLGSCGNLRIKVDLDVTTGRNTVLVSSQCDNGGQNSTSARKYYTWQPGWAFAYQLLIAEQTGNWHFHARLIYLALYPHCDSRGQKKGHVNPPGLSYLSPRGTGQQWYSYIVKSYWKENKNSHSYNPFIRSFSLSSFYHQTFK